MIFPEPVPLTQQAGPRTYLEKSYGPLKLTCCVKNVFFVGIPQLDLFFVSQALGILYIRRQKHQITRYISPMLM